MLSPTAFTTCLAFCLLCPTFEAQQSRRAGSRVDIHYDQHMIPHVFGSDDAAAFFGLGYQQMRDFPVGTLNMLWLYSGRMAEVAGESYVDEDSLIRLWELPSIAERHRAELDERRLLPLLEAYVRGIEAGRAWWCEGGDPSTSSRLDALLGAQLDVFVDRVPDYLNQAFSPFGTYADPDVPTAMRNVLSRMFAPEMPVTVEHVLRLGVAINSFFLLHSNEAPLNVLNPGSILSQESGGVSAAGVPTPGANAPTRPGLFHGENNLLASNGWMISPLRTDSGFPLTHSDGHVGLNKLQIQPYLIQVEGDSYAATGLTMPGYPALYAGYNGHVSWLSTATVGDPVVRNTWSITLEPSPNPQELRFLFQGSSTQELISLEQQPRTVTVFDPFDGTVSQTQVSHYYVPLGSDEPQDLGFTRYPVVSHVAQAPLPSDDVLFQQGAFTVEGSPWEFMVRMGRARNATNDVDAAIAHGLLVVGDGINLMVADTDANFRYVYMVRVPEQGSGVPTSDWDQSAVLDGSQLAWRWQGIHTIAELPQIGPANVSTGLEIWINNNVTPDLVEETRFTEADLATFPGYMVSHETLTTWRQERSNEMLRLGPSAISRIYSQELALDATDSWMHRMWPFYVLARNIAALQLPPGVSTDGLMLMQWVEEYRDHDENDVPNPAYDFVAHLYSQVAVYATLLRSHYLDHLHALHQQDLDQGGAGLTELQLSFGADPAHPLYTDPTPFTLGNYQPNIESMVHALDIVAGLWVEGSGEQGLQNQELLANLSGVLPGDPWGDPRFDTDIEPHWQSIISGTKMTRWGHVNVISLTPHQLIIPKRSVIEGAALGGGDPLEVLRGYLYSALYPPALQSLSYDFMKIPYFDQAVAVDPVGGVRFSMYYTQHKRIHEGLPPAGYPESVYRYDPDDFLYYHPMSSGSQTILSVELGRTSDAQARPAARGRFLQAIGGTGVTVPDLLGNGDLAYQQRFAPTGAFVERQWTDLETQQAALGPPTHTLHFVRLGSTSRRLDSN